MEVELGRSAGIRISVAAAFEFVPNFREQTQKKPTTTMTKKNNLWFFDSCREVGKRFHYTVEDESVLTLERTNETKQNNIQNNNPASCVDFVVYPKRVGSTRVSVQYNNLTASLLLLVYPPLKVISPSILAKRLFEVDQKNHQYNLFYGGDAAEDEWFDIENEKRDIGDGRTPSSKSHPTTKHHHLNKRRICVVTDGSSATLQLQGGPHPMLVDSSHVPKSGTAMALAAHGVKSHTTTPDEITVTSNNDSDNDSESDSGASSVVSVSLVKNGESSWRRYAIHCHGIGSANVLIKVRNDQRLLNSIEPDMASLTGNIFMF